MYVAFEELMLHAGKDARPEWSRPWVNYSPWLPQFQRYITWVKKSQ